MPRLGLALPHALYRTGFLLHEASHSVPPVSAQVCPIHRLPIAIISTVNAIFRTVIAISSTIIAIISTASCRLHEATDRSVRSPHSAGQASANRLSPHSAFLTVSQPFL